MTMQEPTPRRRRASRRKRYIIALVGLAAVFFTVFYGFFWLTNPWAVSLPGKPALTGHWHGELSFAPGDNRRVFLELRGDPPGSKCRGGCPKIKGTGKVCGAGQNTTYEIWGSPLNYSGTRFSLHTRSTTEGLGSYLNGLNGEWDGNDLVTVGTSLTVRGSDGAARATASTDRPPDPPLRFEMQRGSEAAFDGAC
jgi:hypothetical protein